MVQRSFSFRPNELASIRTQISNHLRESSTRFEIITAFLWRCRTMALQLNDDDKVRILYAVNLRSKFNPPLPDGYYGNAITIPMAVITNWELRNTLGYALGLVKKLKPEVSEEYLHSLAEFMAIKGRPPYKRDGLYSMSDVTGAVFDDVDFGWGKAVYGGPAKAYGFASLYVPYKSGQGQAGVIISVCLPGEVMERFVKELDIECSEQDSSLLHYE